MNRLVNKEFENIKKENEYISERFLEYSIKINSIYDLINSKINYEETLTLLINFLDNSKIKNLRVKEGVVRALTIKRFRKNPLLLEKLIKIYPIYAIMDNSLSWAIGNAIGFLVTKADYKYISELISFCKQKKYGKSRQMIVDSLYKFELNKVENTLIKLLYDEHVRLHALSSLVKLKSSKLDSHKEYLLNSTTKTIRNKALKHFK